jgi:hypothetical protein
MCSLSWRALQSKIQITEPLANTIERNRAPRRESRGSHLTHKQQGVVFVYLFFVRFV